MSRGPLLAAACALALTGLLGACAKQKTADLVGPGAAPPAAVTGLMPAGRSTGVIADTEIWAEFDRDLDPATLTTDHLFLKRDTRRIPIAITWEAARRRVHLTPQAPLDLRRTHTVSFTDGVRAADGTALDAFFWQFTTNGVRRPAHPSPAPGAIDESPFVPIAWDSSETSAGTIRYQVFVGPDSAAIAARTAPPLAVTRFAAYVPTPPWTLGETRYWSVRATNTTTQEVADGPVWRFATLPPGLPVDSLALTCTQWSSIRHISNFPDNLNCFGSTVSCGPSYNGAMDWNLSVLGSDVRLADVTLLLTPSNLADPSGRYLTISGTNEAWSACGIAFPGPPYDDPAAAPLAVGEATAGRLVWFHSPALTSHIESRMRGAARSGYRLGSDANFAFSSPTTSIASRRPVLMVRYYVRNAPVAVAGSHP